jgi:mannose-6-phosphate isomerase-like protein (cupin superfamily)
MRPSYNGAAWLRRDIVRRTKELRVEKVSLSEKFATFSEHWQPRIVGELNGQHVKIARLHGEFVWHHHVQEDEMFLVVEGTLAIEFRDRTVTLHEGEFCIVPRGIEHRPVA